MIGECKISNTGMGECDYVPEISNCPFGCALGACLADTCLDVVCDGPPEPTCEGDGQTRVVFEDNGLCNPDTGCQYESTSQTCAHGCDAGQCQPGVCTETSCQSAPADRCDGNVAIRYIGEGQCRDEDGQATCDYVTETENCTYTRGTCQLGVCEGSVVQTGQVVITEYMASPAGIWAGVGEWFEVVNLSGVPINLEGWKIMSGGRTADHDDEEHVITNPPNFPAGARLLFANSADPSQDGTIASDYFYSRFDIILNGYSDWIALVTPEGDVADLVYWEPGSIMEGRSRKLDPALGLDPQVNDDPAHWCPTLDEAEVYGLGSQNYGRPGMENSPCKAMPCQDVICTKPADYCTASGDAIQYQRDQTTCLVTRFNNPWCNFEPQTVACDASTLCFEGVCETLPTNLPEPGELVITELMGNPTLNDSVAEWIEIYNRSERELTLFTLSLRDNEVGGAYDTYQIVDREATVGPGQYIVFARSTDSALNGGIEGAYYYSGNHLKDSPGEGMQIQLVRADGEIISAVHYRTPARGVSQQLNVDFYKEALTFDPARLLEPASWCAGEGTYGTGTDRGTPGTDNLVCPL